MQTAELAAARVVDVETGIQSPEQALPLPAGDSFVDLKEGIRFAMSWGELEGWVVRATDAHQRGKLITAEIEELVELAIGVSRQVPER